jgi:uncharacterized membrane protein YGL010W
MKNLAQWMNEYSQSHTHPTNQLIHKICVPLIMYSLLGVLWSIPFPLEYPFLNWASIFFILCLIFYVRLSFAMAIGMVLQALVMLGICFKISNMAGNYLLYSSLVIFAIAWVFQFIGHHLEGKRPSFFKDLQFLLIGPLWVLYPIYRKIGLSL